MSANMVHHTKGGTYILAKMDGAVSRLQYATFHIVPYLPGSLENILVASLLGTEDLDKVLVHADDYPLADDIWWTWWIIWRGRLVDILSHS